MSSQRDPDVLREIAELERKIFDLRRRVTDGAAAEPAPSGNLALLICRIGNERIALSQSSVDEVVMMARLTPLPEAPPWVAGMLDLRGRAIPVIDLLARVSRERRRPLVSDFIVVGAAQGRQVGLIVQDILDLETASAASLQPAPPELPHGPYVQGLLRLGEAPVVLFSLQRLIATSELPGEPA